MLSACTRRGVLVASTGEHRLTAQDSQTGITAVVTTGVWKPEAAERSRSDSQSHWTALHVLVANLGDTPVLLAPGDFELRDLRGFQYALIDPGATFYRDAPKLRPVGSYAREYRRDYDPGGPVEFIPLDVGGDVGRQALPWGVLEPGTEMRGFVYFEDMSLRANGGTLTWRAMTPGHAPLVQLQFDFGMART